jgi:NitT/TauT family transport system substrate-binding protein
MGANRNEAIAMMKKFYEQGGTTISEASMRKEFDTRPTFDLAGQLRVMDRSRGSSQMDGWFTAMAEFMKGTGAITDVPPANAYITDEFIKMVNADKALRDFANRTN